MLLKASNTQACNPLLCDKWDSIIMNGGEAPSGQDEQKRPSNIFMGPAMESHAYIPVMDLFREIIDQSFLLCVTKLIDPLVVKAESMNILKRNLETALVKYNDLKTAELRGLTSSTKLPYIIDLLLPVFIQELSFYIQNLEQYEYIEDNGESLRAFYSRVLRLDSCEFWHVSDAKSGAMVSTLNDAHNFVFHLDFLYHTIEDQRVSNILDLIEEFMAKVFVVAPILPPILINMFQPCRDCIQSEMTDYKLLPMDSLAEYICPHLCNVHEPVTAIAASGIVDVEESIREPMKSSPSPFLSITRDETPKDIENFYIVLNGQNMGSGVKQLTKEEVEGIGNKTFQKALAINKLVRERQQANYPGWTDAREVLFNKNMSSEEILFSMPILGLTPYEIITNCRAVLVSTLNHVTKAEQEKTKKLVEQHTQKSMISVEDLHRKISQFQTMARGGDPHKVLCSELVDIFEKDIKPLNVKDCIAVHNQKLLGEYENRNKLKEKCLNNNLEKIVDKLKTIVNPLQPTAKITNMTFTIRRAMVARQLFYKAMQQLPVFDPSKIHVNRSMFDGLRSGIEIPTINKMGEIIKRFVLGPIYRNTDPQDCAPIRQGFILHTIWASKGVAADVKLHFAKMCDFSDIVSDESSVSKSFHRLGTHLYELHRIFLLDRRKGVQYSHDDLFVAHITKIRLAVVAVSAFNFIYQNGPNIELQYYDSEDNIACDMAQNGAEVFLPKNGLYIGALDDPFRVIYASKSGIKQCFASLDIFDTLSVFAEMADRVQVQ